MRRALIGAGLVAALALLALEFPIKVASTPSFDPLTPSVALEQTVIIRSGCHTLAALKSIIAARTPEEAKAAGIAALERGECWINSHFPAVIDKVIADVIGHDGRLIRILRFRDPSDGQVGFAAQAIEGKGV